MKGASLKSVDLSRPSPRSQLLEKLRRQLGPWEAATNEEAPAFSCGATEVDRLLPGGGLRQGMLVEWLSGANAQESFHGGRGSAMTLGLLAAREACREGGALVVIDRWQTFYPPAAAAWGIDLERMIVVHPANAHDELWAAVQALRSPAVAAMWATIDRLDSRMFRRLQLAAQAGRTLGVLIRPTRASEQPSWADVTLEVEEKMQIANWQSSAMNNLQFPAPLSAEAGSPLRRVQVQLVRCHSSRAGSSAVLEIDDVAHTVREAKEGYRLSALGDQPSRLAKSQ